MLEQPGAGVGIGAQVALGQLAVDEGGEVTTLVAIAGDRGAVARALDQAAQRRAGRELPGVDDHQRLDRLQREQGATGRGRLVARLAQTDHPPAAEQAERAGLVGKTRRLGADQIDAELGEAKRILGIVQHGAEQALDPLAHQPLVRAVNQDHGNGRIGPAQEALDLAAGKLHVTGVPRAK